MNSKENTNKLNDETIINFAEDSIEGLLDQISVLIADGKSKTVISTLDLSLFKTCYEEDLEELDQIESDNIKLEKYLLNSGLSQDKIDEIKNK